MPKAELQFLKSVKTGKGLIKLVHSLRVVRWKEKIKNIKRSVLSVAQRQTILEKTDHRCHICGIALQGNNFQADHVQTHSSGGAHIVNNYLASCQTCNKYRWHYSPEEIQLILKLGVWAKGQLLKDSQMANDIANDFVKHELLLRKRRMATKL